MSRRLPSKKFKLPIASTNSMSTSKRLLFGFGCIILLGVSGLGTAAVLRLLNPVPEPVATNNSSSTIPAPHSSLSDAPASSTPLQIDPKKNYGNKYADGNLPVGDGKYVTNAAKKGYVYACSPYTQSFTANTTPSTTRGPWFADNNSRYKITEKEKVQGSVTSRGVFSSAVSGASRSITTNNLPLAHTTGTFPITTGDPAHAYVDNPNKIITKSYAYALPAKPTYGTPQCVSSKQVGVMLTGVALHNGFDNGGRDSGAWEIYDECGGHPDSTGEYHYHALSTCISENNARTVVGFALDGFPITGPQIAPDNILTSDDLDECHGITSPITLDGKTVTTYHYVLTQDFPYSVSCFRGKPITPPSQLTDTTS